MTRGKAPITQQIPNDSDASYEAYKSAVQHAAADRKDVDAVNSALSGKKFDGEWIYPATLNVKVKLSSAASALQAGFRLERFSVADLHLGSMYSTTHAVLRSAQ